MIAVKRKKFENKLKSYINGLHKLMWANKNIIKKLGIRQINCVYKLHK